MRPVKVRVEFIRGLLRMSVYAGAKVFVEPDRSGAEGVEWLVIQAHHSCRSSFDVMLMMSNVKGFHIWEDRDADNSHTARWTVVQG